MKINDNLTSRSVKCFNLCQVRTLKPSDKMVNSQLFGDIFLVTAPAALTHFSRLPPTRYVPFDPSLAWMFRDQSAPVQTTWIMAADETERLSASGSTIITPQK